MKKILFACDLDNTLIHSFRHKTADDVCIEFLNDKEQGFMSKEAIKLLKEVIGKVEFVPVTSRSIEQYLRIKWPNGCKPRYAVTTNGAILLDNEKVVDEWKILSSNLVASYMDEMNSILQMLIDENLYLRCRIVDNMYLFAYCKDGVDINECKERYMGRTNLNICPSGKKLYFFPPMFNKGDAIKALKRYLKIDRCVSAGDSTIDLPMLLGSEQAYIPSKSLLDAATNVSQENIKDKFIVKKEDERFAEFALLSVLNYVNFNNGKKHSNE